MNDRIQFWQDKPVFVTGHTGFKGSWLTLWLQFLEAKVTGFANGVPTNPSMFEACEAARRMESIEGDVGDLAALTDALRRSRAEIVFHLAAQPLVRESYRDPVGTFTTNVLGTVNLLEAVRQCEHVKAVVIVTTDKCYVNHEWFWSYREKSQLGGDDPYSASKACAELVTAAYRKSFFNPDVDGSRAVGIASCRAGNVIGGGDWAMDRLVPDTLRALSKGTVLKVRHPHAIRPWQHVLDPLNGYLMLAEALYNDGPQFASAWNFGPFESGEKPVGWIVGQLHALWGGDHHWERDHATHHPHENRFLKLDSSKARMLLGWSPKLDIRTALEWTVAWAKAHQHGESMRDITEQQILQFMALDALDLAPPVEAKTHAPKKTRSAKSTLKARAGAGVALGLSSLESAQMVLERLTPLLA